MMTGGYSGTGFLECVPFSNPGAGYNGDGTAKSTV